MSTRLPYAWARAYRALLQNGTGGAALTVSPHTPAWAMAELRRRYGPLPVRQVSDEELDTLLPPPTHKQAMRPKSWMPLPTRSIWIA